MTRLIVSDSIRRRKAVPAVLLAAALLSGAAAIAADTTPPELKALGLNPTVIDASTGPAEVTLELTVADDDSGVSYFEASLVDPTGTFRQSGDRLPG